MLFYKKAITISFLVMECCRGLAERVLHVSGKEHILAAVQDRGPEIRVFNGSESRDSGV